MTICIHNKAVGSTKHLMVSKVDGEKSFQWKGNIPEDCWVVGDLSHPNSLEEVAKMFRMQVPGIAPDTHIKAFQELDDSYDKHIIPWKWVLPAGEFRQGLQNTVEAATEVICALEDTGYMKTYRKGRKSLQSLLPARVCSKRIYNYIDQNNSGPSSESALKTFLPVAESSAAVPLYSQTSSATGRLTVKSGPSILTLPSKCRDLIRTSFPHGRVVQIDFVSLEPRVAKYISGFDAPTDIYSDMCSTLFNGSIDRKTAKLATLSALYGASSKKLDAVTGADRTGKHLIRSVRRYFGIDRLESELKSSMISHGKILNAYGRPLHPGTTSSHVLVSHFIQSTSVDVALCGFSDLLESFKVHNLNIRPLYIIHDALVIDVEEAQYNTMQTLVQNGVTNDLGHFPVEISGISRS